LFDYTVLVLQQIQETHKCGKTPIKGTFLTGDVFDRLFHRERKREGERDRE